MTGWMHTVTKPLKMIVGYKNMDVTPILSSWVHQVCFIGLIQLSLKSIGFFLLSSMRAEIGLVSRS